MPDSNKIDYSTERAIANILYEGSHNSLKFYLDVKIDGVEKTYYGKINLLYGEDALDKLLESETKSADEAEAN